MTILYINNEHCTSLAQLREYFTSTLSSISATRYDLLDCGRYGDIAQWLREIGEDSIAKKVESINTDLSDSEYINQLGQAITGLKAINCSKPEPNKCFKLARTKQTKKGNDLEISLSFKILMSVNENYEIILRSNWGTRAKQINPSEYNEGEVVDFVFDLRKRPGVEFGTAEINLEGHKEVFKINDNSIEDITYDSKSHVIRYKDSCYYLRFISGGSFLMGATEEQGIYASSHEKPIHRVRINDFYMMESVVTQELWEVIMGNNPSTFKGKHRPVTNVSYYECCEFIKKINRHLKISLRLPTENEWEYAARGGCKRNNNMYSGTDNLSDIAWYIGNSNNVIHDVKLKQPNTLGLYDMSGNVWEWCATKNNSYSGLPVNHSNYYINRGGCATSQENGCRTSRRYYSHPKHKSCFLGFRLVI